MSNRKYFANKKHRIVNGVKVETAETELTSQYNSILAEAGTTGIMPGKSKNSRLYLKIIDNENSNISITKDSSGKGFVLRATGNCEIETLIDALDFSVRELKKQCQSTKSKSYTEPKKDIPATLKQIQLIEKLIDKSPYYIKENIQTAQEASTIIKFLSNPLGKPDAICKRYLARKVDYFKDGDNNV